jgi:hypothetical protein
MGALSPMEGGDLTVSVETSTGPSVMTQVQNMNSVSKSKSRSVNSQRVFGKAVPLRSESTPDEPYTISGFATKGDAGQNFLNAAEISRTPVRIQVLPDGVNGWTQFCYVRAYKFDAKAAEDFDAISYDFTASAPAVIVGTGWTLL